MFEKMIFKAFDLAGAAADWLLVGKIEKTGNPTDYSQRPSDRMTNSEIEALASLIVEGIVRSKKNVK